MKKIQRTGNKRGVDFGKKKFHLLDPAALIISIVIAVGLFAFAAISAATGFDDHWYGDILVSAACVIGFFALLNLGYVLMAGITVQNGSVFLGVDENKNPIGFAYGQLAAISLLDENDESVSFEAGHLKKVTLRFVLKNGAVRDYPTRHLTYRTYRAILTYFDLQE